MAKNAPDERVATNLEMIARSSSIFVGDSQELCGTIELLEDPGPVEVVVTSRPVRRILYRTVRLGDGHPSRPAIARRLQRPTRGRTGGPPFPCSALLRMGFA